jgi:hypothetical protein
VTVSKLAEGLRLVEVSIRLFEDINWNKKRAAKSRQRLVEIHYFYEEILKEKYKSLSPKISVLDFFKPT